MKNAVFVHNNLKVCPYHIHDAPFPGFEVLSWEYQTLAKGTLYDIGDDCGYTNVGNYDISGQIWTTENSNKISELDCFMGILSGKVKRSKTRIYITEENESFEIDAICYILINIERRYKIIESGLWSLRREL